MTWLSNEVLNLTKGRIPVERISTQDKISLFSHIYSLENQTVWCLIKTTPIVLTTFSMHVNHFLPLFKFQWSIFRNPIGSEASFVQVMVRRIQHWSSSLKHICSSGFRTAKSMSKCRAPICIGNDLLDPDIWMVEFKTQYSHINQA